MGITQLLTEIGGGIGSFLPALVTALVDGFVGLFFLTGEGGAITGMSPLAIVSITFFIIGSCYKLVPTIAGWLKLSAKKRRKAKKA